MGFVHLPLGTACVRHSAATVAHILIRAHGVACGAAPKRTDFVGGPPASHFLHVLFGKQGGFDRVHFSGYFHQGAREVRPVFHNLAISTVPLLARRLQNNPRDAFSETRRKQNIGSFYPCQRKSFVVYGFRRSRSSTEGVTTVPATRDVPDSSGARG